MSAQTNDAVFERYCREFAALTGPGETSVYDFGIRCMDRGYYSLAIAAFEKYLTYDRSRYEENWIGAIEEQGGEFWDNSHPLNNGIFDANGMERNIYFSYYNIGCSYARLGLYEDALRYIITALVWGYPHYTHITADEDLAEMFASPRGGFYKERIREIFDLGSKTDYLKGCVYIFRYSPNEWAGYYFGLDGKTVIRDAAPGARTIIDHKYIGTYRMANYHLFITYTQETWRDGTGQWVDRLGVEGYTSYAETPSYNTVEKTQRISLYAASAGIGGNWENHFDVLGRGGRYLPESEFFYIPGVDPGIKIRETYRSMPPSPAVAYSLDAIDEPHDSEAALLWCIDKGYCWKPEDEASIGRLSDSEKRKANALLEKYGGTLLGGEPGRTRARLVWDRDPSLRTLYMRRNGNESESADGYASFIETLAPVCPPFFTIERNWGWAGSRWAALIEKTADGRYTVAFDDTPAMPVYYSEGGWLYCLHDGVLMKFRVSNGDLVRYRLSGNVWILNRAITLSGGSQRRLFFPL
ncbi:MAG: hypothetical protein LBI85_08330 [Spirochaetaceae bacterium]|nr:hypothetical protein [Spirochaetaceae bacterium]